MVWFPAQPRSNYSADTATLWNFVKLTLKDVAEDGCPWCTEVTIKNRKSRNSHTRSSLFLFFFNSLETYTYVQHYFYRYNSPDLTDFTSGEGDSLSVPLESFQCRTKNKILYMNLHMHNSTPTHPTNPRPSTPVFSKR